jgi:cytoplasmic iron level regulating protein YaaA (DUF328/UPF0246 family)
VRILLPPSEGKHAPHAGPALDLGLLCAPELGPARESVLDALLRLSTDQPEQAAAVLRLGPTQAAEAARNAGLRRAPCAPAMQVYTGVLHTALDLPSLPAAALDRVRIASALFGLLAPTDPIPAYRLSAAVRLPGLPPPKQIWAPPLRRVLAAEAFIIDLRSGPYAALGSAAGAVTVRVSTLRGGRKVAVSHFNKAAKGRIARTLLRPLDPPASAEQAAALLRAEGWAAELVAPTLLEVLVPDPVA